VLGGSGGGERGNRSGGDGESTAARRSLGRSLGIGREGGAPAHAHSVPHGRSSEGDRGRATMQEEGNWRRQQRDVASGAAVTACDAGR
jgi:hypothetical protein